MVQGEMGRQQTLMLGVAYIFAGTECLGINFGDPFLKRVRAEKKARHAAYKLGAYEQVNGLHVDLQAHSTVPSPKVTNKELTGGAKREVRGGLVPRCVLRTMWAKIHF